MSLFYPLASHGHSMRGHGGRPAWVFLDEDNRHFLPQHRPNCQRGLARTAGRPATAAPASRNAVNFVTNAASLAEALFPDYFDVVGGGGTSTVAKPSPKNAFEVKLDASHFAPDELTVKTVENSIVVEGKHEEKEDEHGYVSRSFVRRYVLPEGVKLENISCQLTTDGVLILTAPLLVEPEVPKERSIPITLSGQPAGALGTTVPPKEQEVTSSASKEAGLLPTVENIGDEDSGSTPMST